MSLIQEVASPPAAAEDPWRQGQRLLQERKFEQTVACLRLAAAQRPEDVEVVNTLGIALAALGQHAEALTCFEEALRGQPHFTSAHYHRGNTLRRLGRVADAVVCYEEVMRLDPAAVDACNNLGISLLALGKPEEAANRFRQVLRLRPDYNEACNNLGIALAEQGCTVEATAIYRQVLKRHPRAVETHNNLGVVLTAQGRIADAIASYRQALRLKPAYPDAHNNLGNALRQEGKLSEATTALREALRLNPRYAEAHNNLAIALVKQGEVEPALAAYQEALRLKPDYPEAHTNCALAWLLQGDFDQGWPEYEWRWKMKDNSKRTFTVPRWDGSPLDGQAVLLWAEQGLGDTLQFIRYAALVQQRGGVVLVEAPSSLIPLLNRCPGIDRLFPQGSPLPEFAAQVPLLSLPGIFHTTVDTVPASVPYLSAEPTRLERWGAELQSDSAFKIGIAWQGSLKYQDDRFRSLPLRHFEPLARLPGVKFYSLQKKHGAEQVAAVKDWGIIDLGPRLDEVGGAFLDTAAVMQHLDLVVTSDTSLAHLAGALGVPTWVALPKACDWRWLQEREDCPWYPTMRLFRQSRWGDWDEVFSRIAEELRRQRPSRSRRTECIPNDDAPTLRRQGTQLCRERKFREAIGALRRALQIEPQSATAHNDLGVALVHEGQVAEAIAAYEQSLRLRPGYPEALNNLGDALHKQGKLEEAAQQFEAAIRGKPAMAQAHNNLGAVRAAQKQVEQACGHYRKALEYEPGFRPARRNLGAALEQLGKLDDACDQFRRFLEDPGGTAEGYVRLGKERLQQGNLCEAVAAFRLALQKRPDDAETHFQLGVALARQQKLDAAVAGFRESIRLNPNRAGVHTELGNVLRRLKRLAEAEASFRTALRLQPRQAPVINHLGICLISQSRPVEAEACLREAIRCQPDLSQAHNNLGVALEQQGRVKEAISAFQESLRLEPNCADTHKNLGLACLRVGDFEQGWAEYEWRWKCDRPGAPRFTEPRWDGTPLEGRTILLWAEQGLGDTIQFVRYAAYVQARGGTVLVEVPAVLLPLLARCPGIDRLLPQGKPRPHFDVHASLVSVPGILGTTLNKIPGEAPYLSAEPARLEHWGAELQSDAAFKIGIAWQGSSKYQGDHFRSFLLKHFEPLARLPGVRLYSLQKGHGSEQLAAVGDWGVVDLGPKLDEQGGAFLDTAAVMQHLDLVVTCDSSLVHLAGALAVPVWVALSQANDWRWQQDREDTPWYPTVRLFRQHHLGDWDNIFARIAEEVCKNLPKKLIRGPLQVEVSAGELLDKISILEIKRERINDPDKVVNVCVELGALLEAAARQLVFSNGLRGLAHELRGINTQLWDVEDEIRCCEQRQDFGSRFVELARSVYRLNDERSRLKREMNKLCGSSLVEEKSYHPYTQANEAELPPESPPAPGGRNVSNSVMPKGVEHAACKSGPLMFVDRI